MSQYISISPIGNLIILNTPIKSLFVFETNNSPMKNPISRLSDNGYYGAQEQLMRM